MRVAINLEQLLYRVPGGIGRYTARLATLLPALFPEDGYAGFVARHHRRRVADAVRGLEPAMAPVILPLPRPLLYEAWHLVGRPELGRLAPALRHAELVHAPSLAVPPRGQARLVVTVHDVAHVLHPDATTSRGRRFHSGGLAATARRADLVIVVSHAAAADVAAHTDIAMDRIRVVHNGVDHVEVPLEAVGQARARYGLADRPYVLWVGTQEPRKNLRLLVEAFAVAVARRRLPHALALAGPPGWLHEEARSMPGAEALGDRLRILGHVSEDELHALYRGAELFALPSLYEGFGLPAVEAMAQGTAVVCSDTSALPEVTGGAAVLVPPEPGAWGRALADLLEDDARRRDLAFAGRRRAAHLTWERCARATHAVYQEALDMPGAREARPAPS
ncbi:MAG: glycosyltransferase family 4 protein [Actinomycetota bacterium]|nr:glycosyltransferase family 4 protein [Actinomycetota bacterium]